VKEAVEEIKRVIGDEWVVRDPEKIRGYLTDETAEPVRPEPCLEVVVVKPASTEEVSEVLKIANKYRIPVFPRGGGTGLVGGCIPTRKGIVLSLERMNKIEVDLDNLMAIAEAGATLRDLIEAAEKAGLFFPPHPGDEGAQIGGLIACNAGGARAVKTGVMRNYVKGLEVVLPTGEILWLGGKLVKNNAGYDLMQLIIGSEGTLAVITKAVIRLYPKYEATATLIIPFITRKDAVRAAPKILQSGVIPLALEYVERELVEKSASMLGLKWPCEEGKAYLLVILAEQSEEALLTLCEKVMNVCLEAGSLEPLIAERRDEQENILKIRSEIYTALKPETVDILDVAVPPALMGELMDRIDEIAERYGTYIPAYGHIGDGNLHPHIMAREGWPPERYDAIRSEIYKAAVKLGGTITGEHGIGAIRKDSLRKFLSGKEIKLMRQIKRIFDPNNILNPGKVLP